MAWADVSWAASEAGITQVINSPVGMQPAKHQALAIKAWAVSGNRRAGVTVAIVSQITQIAGVTINGSHHRIATWSSNQQAFGPESWQAATSKRFFKFMP